MRLNVSKPLPSVCDVRRRHGLRRDGIGAVGLASAPTRSVASPTPSAALSPRSSRQHSELKVRVRAYGGPEIWLPQLDEGKIDFGAHFAATAWLSYKKVDTKVQTPHLRLVRAGAATVPLGFMVRADSDIKSVADLKGRRVAGGYGSHPIMKRLSEGVLKAYGIEMSDVKVVPVPAALDGAKAIQDGRADAAWYAVFAPDHAGDAFQDRRAVPADRVYARAAEDRPPGDLPGHGPGDDADQSAVRAERHRACRLRVLRYRQHPHGGRGGEDACPRRCGRTKRSW